MLNKFKKWLSKIKLVFKQFEERNLPVDLNRRGECNLYCLNCCHNIIRCPFWKKWKDEKGAWRSMCLIYKWRPKQCRNSPRTIDCLKKNCSYYFVDNNGEVIDKYNEYSFEEKERMRDKK